MVLCVIYNKSVCTLCFAQLQLSLGLFLVASFIHLAPLQSLLWAGPSIQSLTSAGMYSWETTDEFLLGSHFHCLFFFFFFNCDLLTWFQLGASPASSRFVLFLNSRRFLFCLRCMKNCSSCHFFYYYYYFVDALFGIPALVVMSIWSGLSRRRAFETSHP